MITHHEMPLRQVITDVGQPQIDLMERAKLLLEGFSGVRVETPARALTLRALAERDLEGAVELLYAVFPTLKVGPIEVVRLEAGRLEPYACIQLRTPEEFVERVADELRRRGGSIEELEPEAGWRTLASVAPVEQLLGFDGWLSNATAGKAIAQYRFEQYRARRP
jgi:hypothetical protein